MQQPWKKVKEETVYENPYWRVDEERWVTPSGNELDWYVQRKDPFAMVVPFDGTHLYFVSVFRPPLGRYILEFPAGGYSDGDSLGAARRELEEETGFVAGKLTEIGSAFSSTGVSGAEFFVYLAEDLKEGVTKHDEGEEGIEVVRVPVEKVGEMIRRGEIRCGETLAAYLMFLNREDVV